MDPIIVMYVQLGIAAFTLIAFVVQAIISQTQIRKQDSIIKGMEAYTRILDLQKVEQYVQMRERTITDMTAMEKRNLEEQIRSNELEPLKVEKDKLQNLLLEVLVAHITLSVKSLSNEKRREAEFLVEAKDIYLRALPSVEKIMEPDGKDTSLETQYYLALNQLAASDYPSKMLKKVQDALNLDTNV